MNSRFTVIIDCIGFENKKLKNNKYLLDSFTLSNDK